MTLALPEPTRKEILNRPGTAEVLNVHQGQPLKHKNLKHNQPWTLKYRFVFEKGDEKANRGYVKYRVFKSDGSKELGHVRIYSNGEVRLKTFIKGKKKIRVLRDFVSELFRGKILVVETN